MFWIVLLLILLGGGFYFYQRLTDLEREIRAEQEREKEKEQQARQGSDETSAAAPLETKPTQPPALTVAAADSAAELAENPILRIICTQPGVVQSDLYADLPQLNKKQAQQMVRELVEAGMVRRERRGSSYKLYLV